MLKKTLSTLSQRETKKVFKKCAVVPRFGISMPTQNYTGFWDRRNIITTVNEQCY